MTVRSHVFNRFDEIKLETKPFPHFFLENVFPEDFYDYFLKHLALRADFKPLGFDNRTFSEEHGEPELDFMLTKAFADKVLNVFHPYMRERFPAGLPDGRVETRMIRDSKGYSIGPHTDAAWKVISLLFYLPPTNEFEEFGTSIYLPKDKNMVCAGGPHYRFRGFDKLKTAPFRRNSCFGFFKTNNSFHGVEPIPVQFNRDILLYNIYSNGK